MSSNIPQKEEEKERKQHPLPFPHFIMEIEKDTCHFGSLGQRTQREMRAEPERDRTSSSNISNKFHGAFLMFKYDLSSAFSYFILQFCFKLNVILL